MEQKLTNRSFEPREFNKDYKEGKLTAVEWIILGWIWKEANPFDGAAYVSYPGLAHECPANISALYARKVLSELRKKHYLYFSNHSGKGGAFPVYPVGYLRAGKKIQTWESLTNCHENTKFSQAVSEPETMPDDIPEEILSSSQEEQIHRIKEAKDQLLQHVSINKDDSSFTGSYNDSDTDKYTDYRYSSKGIDIRSFFPKTYEEQQCKEIATALGEADMRFILSRLKKDGIEEIKRNWSITKERMATGEIRDPRRYFNSLFKK